MADDFGLAVIDSVAGAGVTITGLAYTAWIDKQAISSQRKRGIGRELVKNAGLVFLAFEYDRVVRVAY